MEPEASTVGLSCLCRRILHEVDKLRLEFLINGVHLKAQSRAKRASVHVKFSAELEVESS